MPMPSLRAAVGIGNDAPSWPFQRNSPGGRLQRAVDHLDEGRLAGAVFAQKGMDLAGR